MRKRASRLRFVPWAVTGLAVALCGAACADMVFEMDVTHFGSPLSRTHYSQAGDFTGYVGLPPAAEVVLDSDDMAFLELDTTQESGAWSLEWYDGGGGASEVLETGTWNLIARNIIFESSIPGPSPSYFRQSEVEIRMMADPGLLVPTSYSQPFDWNPPLGPGQWFELTLEGQEIYGYSVNGPTYDFIGTITGRIVPEPATLAFLGIGLAGVIVSNLRKRA